MSELQTAYRSVAPAVAVEAPRAFDTLEVPIVVFGAGLVAFVPEALRGHVGSVGTIGLLMIALAIHTLVSQVRARTS